MNVSLRDQEVSGNPGDLGSLKTLDTEWDGIVKTKMFIFCQISEIISDSISK